MRYITYKLTFPSPEYGFGPEPTVQSHGSILVASSFVENDGTHLGFLTGDIDITTISEWSAIELTQSQALQFAQQIHSEAFLVDDGTIATPPIYI